MTGAPPLQLAIERLRAGDLDAARTHAEAARRADPNDARALTVLGDVHCHAGDGARGAACLREALALAPGDVGIRLRLASALMMMIGAAEEAEAICPPDLAEADATGALIRMRAHVLHHMNHLDAAEAVYDRIVSRWPDDFEAWNNLGNVRRQRDDLAGAIAALEHARDLRPDSVAVQYNLGMALAAAGRLDGARAAFFAAAERSDGDPGTLLELSRVLNRLDRSPEALNALGLAIGRAPERVDLRVLAGLTARLTGDLARAEAELRRALELAPGEPDAVMHLGNLFDASNRVDDLRTLLADTPDAPRSATGLLKARLLRHDGKLAEALAVADATPDDRDPERRAEVIGDIADRMGDSARAFAAFSEMNRLAAAARPDAQNGAARYRAEIDDAAALMTPEWFASWKPVPPRSKPPAPIILVGFPRSGTTLLDTILMGHPALHVQEELPVLHPAAVMLGDDRRIAALDNYEIGALRDRYFEEVATLAPDAANRRLVDKMPLHIRHAALLHRLFPDARWIFAERHPCDVVLSCYITNFRLNYAMANFLDLGDAAALYDGVLGLWEKAKAVFPLRVHTIRYERMVADLEAEVRPLFEFIGVDWDPAVLDHGRTAKGRGYIRSASYAQVTEPIYSRAAGRWRRYRTQLEPVLPVLAPWARRMGYEI